MADTSSPPTTDKDEGTSDSFPLTSVILGLCLVALLTFSYYMHERITLPSWRQYGVKEPWMPLLFRFGEDIRSKNSKLLDQNGNILGYRQGSQMVLLTSNLNLMKHILVKDFGNFVERVEVLRSKSPFAKSLFFAKQTEWRRHRQIVSPTFSTGKLKYVSQWIDKSAQDLTSYIEDCSRSGKLVPIKDLASQYTGEIIARTAFGLDVNFIGENEHEFLHFARTMIHPLSGTKRVIFQVLDLIPKGIQIVKQILPNLQYWDPISLDGTEYFKSTLRETIAEKRNQQVKGVPKRHVDFVDLLLKANDAAKEGRIEEMVDDNNDANIMKKSVEGGASALSDEEVVGHSMLIIFAGMETTATTLQMSLYQLARNPDVQDKVFHEIDSIVQSTTPSSEELSSLHYMDQVINETLRLHPPVPLVNRKALETRTYDGITVPKGAAVIIPYYHIMADPKVYPNPKMFNPDRFSPEEKEKRHLMAFIPFGQGPRQCLGMRLAYLELKIALVHVVRKLKVVLNNTTVPKMGEEVRFKSQNLLTPVNKIMLSFELRERVVVDS